MRASQCQYAVLRIAHSGNFACEFTVVHSLYRLIDDAVTYSDDRHACIVGTYPLQERTGTFQHVLHFLHVIWERNILEVWDIASREVAPVPFAQQRRRADLHVASVCQDACRIIGAFQVAGHDGIKMDICQRICERLDLRPPRLSQQALPLPLHNLCDIVHRLAVTD